jgi:hypothetical protein
MGGRGRCRALWGFEQRGRGVRVGARRSNGLVEAVEAHEEIAAVESSGGDEWGSIELGSELRTRASATVAGRSPASKTRIATW